MYYTDLGETAYLPMDIKRSCDQSNTNRAQSDQQILRQGALSSSHRKMGVLYVGSDTSAQGRLTCMSRVPCYLSLLNSCLSLGSHRWLLEEPLMIRWPRRKRPPSMWVQVPNGWQLGPSLSQLILRDTVVRRIFPTAGALGNPLAIYFVQKK